MANYADECMNNYPPDHKPAMVVPKGGSSCAKCIFLTKDKKHCSSQYYIRWRLSKGEIDASLIPAPVNRYCSDWFRPRKYAGRFKLKIKNPFWRADTGYHHEKGITAGDVVRYEQQELGNDYGITEKQLKELDRYPAWCLVWVTKKKKDAERYGRPRLFDVGKSHKVIAEDGDGGYLILMLGNGKKSNPVSRSFLKGQDEPKVRTGDYVRVFEPHTGKWLDGFVRSLPEEKKGIWWIKVRIGDREVTAVWNGDDFILGRV